MVNNEYGGTPEEILEILNEKDDRIEELENDLKYLHDGLISIMETVDLDSEDYKEQLKQILQIVKSNIHTKLCQ
jgi:hypothetical protein